MTSGPARPSPSRPPVISNTPKPIPYAATTNCSGAGRAPRSVCIGGSAMLTKKVEESEKRADEDDGKRPHRREHNGCVPARTRATRSYVLAVGLLEICGWVLYLGCGPLLRNDAKSLWPDTTLS
jgi:hypothetical protein